MVRFYFLRIWIEADLALRDGFEVDHFLIAIAQRFQDTSPLVLLSIFR